METKAYKADLHSLSSRGEFKGYASSYNTDRERDQIMPGAFEGTLKMWRQRKKLPPLLWHHDTQKPIGFWRVMHEDTKGLWVEGTLILSLQQGNEVYQMMKAGILDGLSVGFQTVVSKCDPKAQVRKIFQLNLFEISVVTTPANPDAQITNVKNFSC